MFIVSLFLCGVIVICDVCLFGFLCPLYLFVVSSSSFVSLWRIFVVFDYGDSFVQCSCVVSVSFFVSLWCNCFFLWRLILWFSLRGLFLCGLNIFLRMFCWVLRFFVV